MLSAPSESAPGFAAVLTSFWIEVLGYTGPGHGLRAAAVLIYFGYEVPAHKAKFNIGTLALTLRVALVSIPIGYVLAAGWPERLITMLHVAFITGFGLLTFTVATRVIFGHCGQSHRFKQTLPAVIAMAVLFILALILRVWADYSAPHRLTLYGIAASIWASGLLIWGACLLPGVRRPDDS